jgi:hypothetical protein
MLKDLVKVAQSLNGSKLKSHLTVQSFFEKAMAVAQADGRSCCNRKDLETALKALSPNEAKALEAGLISYLSNAH